MERFIIDHAISPAAADELNRAQPPTSDCPGAIARLARPIARSRASGCRDPPAHRPSTPARGARASSATSRLCVRLAADLCVRPRGGVASLVTVAPLVSRTARASPSSRRLLLSGPTSHPVGGCCLAEDDRHQTQAAASARPGQCPRKHKRRAHRPLLGPPSVSPFARPVTPAPP